MAEQQAIKLKIAGKSYSFTLKHEEGDAQSLADKEELYRLAEREVNAYVTRFEKARYEGFSTQDCLAMAALQLAISNIAFHGAERSAAKICNGWRLCSKRSTSI